MLDVDRLDATVRKFLGAKHVVSVDTEEDEDRDGNLILRVRIVFDETAGEMEVARMLDLPSILRAAIEDPGTERGFGFPVVSYIEVKEAPTRHAAE